MTCKSTSGTPKDDLKEYVEKLFSNYSWTIDKSSPNLDNSNSYENLKPNQPQVIWSMYFNIPSCLKCVHANESPYDGIYLSCGPFFELDYDLSIKGVI